MSLLELRQVTKSFGGTRALHKVDLAVDPGEIRGLVGENGSGKTTLIRVLAGEIAPDSGAVIVGGDLLPTLDPTARLRHGVGVVFQEARVCPALTVTENLFLGRLPSRAGRVRWKEARRQAQAIIDQAGLGLDADQRVSDISQDAQHLTEVARVLASGSQVMAFDETTASLTTDHVERLFTVIRGRADSGTAVVFVSHRLDEVLALCHTVTVLRDGRVAATLNSATTTQDEIVQHMVGRSLDSQYVRRTAANKGAIRLQVRGLLAKGLRTPIDLNVRAGEVVGVGGLVGSGRTELLEAIYGLRRRDGSVVVGGATVTPNDPSATIAHGVGFVPEDRRAQGLAMEQSIARNATMVLTGSRPLVSVPRHADERRLIELLFQRLRLLAANVKSPVRNLSGGNQQKIVLGRWLWQQPDVLLLDEPTRGIDIGAKREIYDLIEDLGASGTAILLVSSELPELLGLCDRILVLREGRLVGQYAKGVSEHELGGAMSGIST